MNKKDTNLGLMELTAMKNYNISVCAIGELPGASPGGPNSAWDFREKLPKTMTLEWRREKRETS